MPKRMREPEPMLAERIFVENSKAVKLISDEAVLAALAADLGQGAKLHSWETVPYTNKGDTMAAFVTSIRVIFKKGNQNWQTSYVVKLNPCQEKIVPDVPVYEPLIFNKEGTFYLGILPELNKLMAESGQKHLPFPKCYYAQFVHGKEMFIFEDLHLKGFKIGDRRKGMDLQHAILVIQALGRLHAASKIMIKKHSIDVLKSRYPLLFHEFWAGKMLQSVLVTHIITAKAMLSRVGGHENAMNWLDIIIKNIHEFYEIKFSSCPPFNAICHGDCWNNNVLFRYNETGLPVEVMFFDVPMNRFASLATDLNYFMFTSMEGTVRKPNIGHLLNEYYITFSSVIERYGQNLPFTREELLKEYRSKNDYGLIIGTVIISTLVMSMEDLPDLTTMNIEDIQKILHEWQQKVLASLDKNPICKPRFVAMFDEMLEAGLFS